MTSQEMIKIVTRRGNKGRFPSIADLPANQKEPQDVKWPHRKGEEKTRQECTQNVCCDTVQHTAYTEQHRNQPFLLWYSLWEQAGAVR